MATLTIDNVDYESENLSENAMSQLVSLQAVDQRIAALQGEFANLQTARIAYGNALKQEL